MSDLVTSLLALFFFCLPWLLIWQLFRVRRRMREADRQRLEQAAPARPSHVDAVSVDADGRIMARPDSFDPVLAAADRNSAAADDLKNLEGRR